jgi:hypothetical protein
LKTLDDVRGKNIIGIFLKKTSGEVKVLPYIIMFFDLANILTTLLIPSLARGKKRGAYKL